VSLEKIPMHSSLRLPVVYDHKVVTH
jgi:hypothetical protein